MTEAMLRVLLFDAFTCFAGCGILLLVGWPLRQVPVGTVGIAYLAGTAWLGVASSLWLMLGGGLSLAAALLILLAPLLVPPVMRHRPTPPLPGALGWLAAPAIVGAALVALRGTSYPMRGWDAWAFWVPRARSIVELGGLSPDYLRSGVANPDYPPFVPALEAGYLRAQGSLDTTLIHFQLGLLLAAFVAAASALVLPRAPRWAAAAALFVLVTSPTVYTQTLDAYADVPLAAFVTGGALLAWQGLSDRRAGASLLAALLFAAAMLTKVEGTIFVVAVIGGLLLTRPRPRPVRPALLILAAAALLSVIPWRIWLRVHEINGTYRFDFGHAVNTGRVFSAAGSLAHAAVEPTSWLFLPLVIALSACYAFAAGSRRDALFIVCTVATAAIALDLIYAGSSYPFAWYVRTSVDRVIDTPIFLATAFAPILFADRVDAATSEAVVPAAAGTFPAAGT